jgi:hypothetical protein
MIALSFVEKQNFSDIPPLSLVYSREISSLLSTLMRAKYSSQERL